MSDYFFSQDKPTGLYVNKGFSKKEDVIDFFEEHRGGDEDQPEEFLGKSIRLDYGRLLLSLMMFGLSILALRLYYLQVYRGGSYYALSEGNRVRQFNIMATRGIIFGRQGDILVRNVPRFSVLLTVADLPNDKNDRELVLEEISRLINVNVIEIKENIKQQEKNRDAYRPFSIKNNLEYQQALKLQIAIKDLAGVNLKVEQQREYLGGESLSPVIGYVGKVDQAEYDKNKDKDYLLNDIIGKIGLEYTYEDHLRGVNGVDNVEVDAIGKIKKKLNTVKPLAGNNIYLTIDTDLQKKTTEITKEVLEKNKKFKASVIILDPNTGEVLSLLSFPTYDNNMFAGQISSEEYQKLLNDPNNPLFFRAISGEYPAGSTIKPVWSALGLQEGVITENTSFMSTGGIRYGQWFFPDWKAGGHGATNVRKAIAESVNTFYYYLGGGGDNFKGMGIDVMSSKAPLFGIGELTGVDLPGERAGFMPSAQWKQERKNEPWYIGDTYHVSIGQGDLLATPLQVAVWTAFFANNGKIIKPYLVSKIEADGKKEIINPVIVRENFIDEKNIEIVKQGMRDGVKKGSSSFLSDLPISSGGKTGTAQWNTNKDNHAWWTGFAPYEKPQIAITILVEEGEEGSKIAVPIAKKILQWWYDNRMNAYKKITD